MFDTYIVTMTELSDLLQYSWPTIKHNSPSKTQDVHPEIKERESKTRDRFG